MLTDTFAGRYLLWRAPTEGDLRRFPASTVGVPPAPVPGAGPPLALSALALPGSGLWPGGSLQALLKASDSTAFVVLRGGRLGFEWYAAGWDGSTPGRTMSVTKSVAALLVGQAVGAGRLPGVDAPIGELVDGIADAGVARLTLAQLLRMASGIGYREGVLPWHDDARVYHGTQLRRQVLRVRLVDAVDRRFHYNDWHPLLVAMALEHAGGAPVAELLARDLWGPLGAGEATLSLDHQGGGSLAQLESGLNATAYGLARFGQLVLQRGQWGGPHAGAGGLAGAAR